MFDLKSPSSTNRQRSRVAQTAPGLTPLQRNRLFKLMALTVVSAATITGVSVARAQTGGQSAEMGRVISSIPVIQQIAVPRQVCSNEQVTVPGQKSGAGAAMGGLAGGAIGNQIGSGSGRAVATMLGLVGGAVLGNTIEGGGQPQTQNVQHCTTQNVYENRTVGYNVTYEYAGKQYTVQMPQDPGPWVRLQVTPMTPPPGNYAPPVQYQQPPTQYQQAPVYTAPQSFYAPAPVQAPVTYLSPTVFTSSTTYLPTGNAYVRPYPYPYSNPYPYAAQPTAQIRVNLSNQRNPDQWREPHGQREVIGRVEREHHGQGEQRYDHNNDRNSDRNSDRHGDRNDIDRDGRWR
jgi:uncharacterized protein YcfJ